jgi:hypothetical protein
MIASLLAAGPHEQGRKAMKKLILFAAALVMAGGASAYAQTKDTSGEHVTAKHRRAMAAHAHWQAREGVEGPMNYQTPEYIPQMIAPPYDDPEAEGRTNGG